MAKRQVHTDSGRSARQARTGLDRFAAPEEGSSAGQQESAVQRSQNTGRQERVRQAQAEQRRKAGSQSQTTRMTPTQQPQNSRRPMAPGRTERERSLHLRKVIKRKERRARMYKWVAVFLSLVCGILALTTFFQVESIAIEGLSRYAADEIEQALGIQQGDNLFFCDRKGAEKRLQAQYPYFESVWIERDMPNQLIVHIKEAKPIAAVNGIQGGWFVLDKNCRVLERTDQSGANGIAQVMGIRTSGAEAGQTLTADNIQAVEDLKILANALDTAGLAGKATLYNLQDSDNIWFLYEERFAVCVGDTGELPRKLAILDALIQGDQFTPSDRGSINLALGDRAITNTNLSAIDVLKTARGQMDIERIYNQTIQKQEDSADTEESGE
ncbi:MAG: FtsQ-type POTRA domain-containing protein [Butyricicoccus pullicaecorum]|nr:FtsQ-type POTRA domain-containing protein [Butyricicoccus pullicaecorum]